MTDEERELAELEAAIAGNRRLNALCSAAVLSRAGQVDSTAAAAAVV